MLDDLKALQEKAMEAFRRDITNILGESAKGKLSASSARDIVAYIKILRELTQEERDQVKDLSSKTQEELKELARQLIK